MQKLQLLHRLAGGFCLCKKAKELFEVFSCICLPVFFLLFSIATGNAQNINLVNVKPSLPSSSGISKVGDIPVDLHTGIPSINIPVTEIDVSGFKIPVSIGYIAGGIKTEDVASNVGLGWVLNAGGQINKLVFKYPDEGIDINGFVHDTVTQMTDGFGNPLLRNTNNKKNWKYTNDLPDLYKVFAPDLNCRFTNLEVHSPKQKVKVEKLSEGGFLLTNISGVKYYFNLLEDSAVVFLGKIVLPNNNTILFEYEPVIIRAIKPYGKEVYYESQDTTIQDFLDDGLGDPFAYEQKTGYRVASIKFPGGKLQFVYQKNRLDLEGASALTSILRFDSVGVSYLRKTADIRFHQSYFECKSFSVRLNPAANSRYKALFYRLRLDSLSFTGWQQAQTYSFQYDTTELPLQNSLAQDHWGYYNGQNNQSLITSYIMPNGTNSSYSNRACKKEFAQAGILQKIIYPTGGYTQFDYELNTTRNLFAGYESHYTLPWFKLIGTKSVPVPIRESQHGYTVFAGFNFEIKPIAEQGGIQGENVSFSFARNKISIYQDAIFYSVLIIPLAAGNSNFLAKTIDTIIGLPQGSVASGVALNVFLPAGLYRMYCGKVTHTNSEGIPEGDLFSPATLTFKTGGPVLNNAPFLPDALLPDRYPSGGLRIKKITMFDGIDHARDMIQRFRYNVFSDTLKSSGSLGVEPEYQPSPEAVSLTVPYKEFYFISAYTRNEIIIFYQYPAQQYLIDNDMLTILETEEPKIGYTTLSKIRTKIEPVPGSVMSYDNYPFHVKMATGNRSTLKPVESYTGYSNVTIEYGIDGAGGKKELTYYNTGSDWQRSLLLKEKLYQKRNGQYSPVAETVNNYSIDANWYQLNSGAGKQYAQDDTTKTTTTRTYYSYATPFLSLPSKVARVNSAGDSVITERKYISDFPGITASDAISKGIKNMYDKNMLALPVEVTEYEKTAAGNRQKLTSAFTEYKTNAPLPSTLHASEVVSSTASFETASVLGGGVVISNLYKPKVQFTMYDEAGNLLEQYMESNIPQAITWGYNKRYVTAEIVNATAGQVYYNSFEEGEGNIDSYAKAGARSHTGNYTVSFAASPGLPLVITYWSFNGVSWTLYSSAYIQGMTLTGQKIDEIRIHPATAQMMSYTYKPGIGITSKCDANNRYVYYEYDGEGKLIAIKDDKGDIIEAIQYQTKIVPNY